MDYAEVQVAAWAFAIFGALAPVVAEPEQTASSGSSRAQDDTNAAAIGFVLALARALHRYGTPAHRLEEAMRICCHRLGLDAEVFSTPTAIIMSFNLTSEYFSDTRDFGIITTTPAEVAEVDAVFQADWNNTSITPSVASLVWSPTNSRPKLTALISAATKTLDIYCEEAEDPGTLGAMVAAVKRGVKVRFIAAVLSGWMWLLYARLLGRLACLIGLLGPGATVIADGDGLASAALRPIEGADQIARYLADIAGRAPGNMTFLERGVNGQPGLVARQDGVTVTVLAFDVAADQIKHIWAIRNPDKLGPWTTS